MREIQTPHTVGYMPHALIIYLDQNKWIELLKAESGASGSSKVVDVLVALRAAISDGRVVVPLSSAHYLETWHRTDSRSRHALATLMCGISKFVTMSPVQHLLCLEVESFLLRYYRWKYCLCVPVHVKSVFLGWGVSHAFNSPTGRFRFVDSIAADDQPEGKRADAPARVLELFRRANVERSERYEWWSLAGGDEVLSHSGVDVRAEHRLGTGFQQDENEAAVQLLQDPCLRSRLDDYLVLQETISITDPINRIAYWHGASLDNLMDEWQTVGPEFGRNIVESLPTRACMFYMRRAKHENPQWKWEQHDRADIGALSAAVPYCDVVVTERQWAHVLRTAKLDRRFGTTIISRLTDLLPILADTVDG